MGLRTPDVPLVDEALLESIRKAARPLTEDAPDFDELVSRLGDAQVVLLGEATHGTHEFYRERARITKRLITEKGFSAIAVEADWPDAYRVNRYVHGAPEDADAERALGGFERFPTWMWRNAEVLDFVGWLRAHNDSVTPPVGFYGLDLYSLFRSIEEVIAYLDRVDPASAEAARQRYSCLSKFEESQNYGFAAARGLTPACRGAVLQQLMDLRIAAEAYLRNDGIAAEDEQFYAEENARLVVSAEQYYRTMFSGSVASWNLRDNHMASTLERLVFHLERRGRGKTVVWAHNSHVGDARQTSMSSRGEHNLGQLAHQRFGRRVKIVGFTTFDGTVTAASNWDEPARRREVRPAVAGSVEDVFHQAGPPRFWLPLDDGGDAADRLAAPRLERAIGVVYRPETEMASHYFEARVAGQFDHVIHIDRSRAVEPLETRGWQGESEPPETYPVAL